MERLTKRQAQIVEFVGLGYPDKSIAQALHISVDAVRFHIQIAAKKIPGNAPPRRKLTLFFLNISDPGDAA